MREICSLRVLIFASLRHHSSMDIGGTEPSKVCASSKLTPTIRVIPNRSALSQVVCHSISGDLASSAMSHNQEIWAHMCFAACTQRTSKRSSTQSVCNECPPKLTCFALLNKVSVSNSTE